MGIYDVVGDRDKHSITVTIAMMEDVLEWLADNNSVSYPKLTDVGDDLDLRPQEVNAAIEQLDVARWNVESNSNIRIVNPAAFPEKELPKIDR